MKNLNTPWKRTLSFFLAVVMVLTPVLTGGIIAAGEPTGKNQIVSNGEWQTTADGKVQHAKTIEQTGENTFEITLTAKTKEDVQTQVVSKDAAVVLVLDASNSMSSTDMANAKTAAKNFVAEFVKEAGDGLRYVAVVEFGSNGKTTLYWTDANGNLTAVNNGIDAVQNGFAYRSGNGACNTTGTHTHEEAVYENFMEWTDGYLGDGYLGGHYQCTYEGCDYTTQDDKQAKRHNHQTGTTINTYTGPHGGERTTDGGGTNIEAGLRLANNLLSETLVSAIGNKYVVMMTDGVPTYHVDGQPSDVNFISGSRGGGNEAEHDDYHDIYCTQTRNVGNNHVRHGDNLPKQIKDKGAKLYTVSYKSSDINGKTVNGQSIDAWLSSFATQSIAAGDDIFSGLQSIAQIIVNQAQAWILTDPMGDYIDFGANASVARVTNATAADSDAVRKFNTDTDTLIWDLKNDISRTGPVDGWYTYTMTYSVTLDTKAEGFTAETAYAANKTTSLTYMLTVNGQLQPTLYSTNLKVPTVKGYLGSLSFAKLGENSVSLDGTAFTLTSGSWSKTVTLSGGETQVSFTGIPSGHSFTLTETVAAGYDQSQAASYTFDVVYGEVKNSTVPANGVENKLLQKSFTVEHWFETGYNTGAYEQNLTSYPDEGGVIKYGETKLAAPYVKTIEGFAYDASVAGSVTEIAFDSASLTLKLYYRANQPADKNFTVEHWFETGYNTGAYEQNLTSYPDEGGVIKYGETKLAAPYVKTVEGFAYDASVAGSVTEIAFDSASLTLKLYYRANQPTNLSYTVEHYYVGEETPFDTDSFTNIAYDTKVKEVADSDALKAGYVRTSVNGLPATIHDNSTVIKVYYNLRGDLSYTVKHYYVGEETPFDTDSFTNIAYDTPVNEVADSDALKAGYVRTDVNGLPATIQDNSTVIEVYYDLRGDLSYTVKHYYVGENTIRKIRNII